jgi:hypothetical protein
MKKKKFTILFLITVILFLVVLTNPTEEDYLLFSKEDIGLPIPNNVEIERINFFFYSTYSIQALPHEHGIVHLGFLGNFYKISEGQYDYPKWLEFFN